LNLSANFHLAEFDCHSGTKVPDQYRQNLVHLVQNVLQPIRDEWMAPLIVVSGYRTPDWNQRVGGVPRSTHLTVEGADIRPIHMRDVARFHQLVVGMHTRGVLSALGGIGEYPHWVHIDSRQIGHLRRWAGRGMGSEPGS